MQRLWWLMLVTMISWGCSESRPLSLVDAGLDARQDSWQPDQGQLADASPASDLQLSDITSSLDQCICPEGEVWRGGSCMPTVEIGCGSSCDPDDPSSCPEGRRCDRWGARACCYCEEALPACVPDPPLPDTLTGPLRIQPTFGGAGEPVSITVEGAPFYVGALFYLMRLGDEEQMVLNMQQCTIQATFTPSTPGIYPVEVSQYGGDPPWVLAGFYIASGGIIPPPQIQPGYPCLADPAPDGPKCLSGGSYTCACENGRCQCK